MILDRKHRWPWWTAAFGRSSSSISLYDQEKISLYEMSKFIYSLSSSGVSDTLMKVGRGSFIVPRFTSFSLSVVGWFPYYSSDDDTSSTSSSNDSVSDASLTVTWKHVALSSLYSSLPPWVWWGWSYVASPLRHLLYLQKYESFSSFMRECYYRSLYHLLPH